MAGPWEDFQASDPQQPTGGPWEDFQQPQQQPQAGPWNDFQQGAPAYKPTPESSGVGAFARDLAEEQIPMAGGLGGAMLGTAGGFAAAGPAGALVGGVIGGLGGGAIASSVQEWLKAKMGIKDGEGWFSDAQRAADQEQHPWARRAADIVSTAEAFGGGPASGMAKLASGGINAAIEGGSEYAQNGSVDPIDIALKFATGYALPNPRGLVGKGFDATRDAAQRLTGRTSPLFFGTSEAATPPAKREEGSETGSQTEYEKQTDTGYNPYGEGYNPYGEGDLDTGRTIDLSDTEDTPDAYPSQGGPQRAAVSMGELLKQHPNATQGFTTGDIAPDIQSALPKAPKGPAQGDLFETHNEPGDQEEPGIPVQQPTAAAPPPATPYLQSTDHTAAPGLRYEIARHEDTPVRVNRTLPIPENNGVRMVDIDGTPHLFLDRKSIPLSVDVGGKPLDPAHALAVREQARQAALKTMGDNPNHDLANEAADFQMDKRLKQAGYAPDQFTTGRPPVTATVNDEPPPLSTGGPGGMPSQEELHGKQMELQRVTEDAGKNVPPPEELKEAGRGKIGKVSLRVVEPEQPSSDGFAPAYGLKFNDGVEPNTGMVARYKAAHDQFTKLWEAHERAADSIPQDQFDAFGTHLDYLESELHEARAAMEEGSEHEAWAHLEAAEEGMVDKRKPVLERPQPEVVRPNSEKFTSKKVETVDPVQQTIEKLRALDHDAIADRIEAVKDPKVREQLALNAQKFMADEAKKAKSRAARPRGETVQTGQHDTETLNRKEQSLKVAQDVFEKNPLPENTDVSTEAGREALRDHLRAALKEAKDANGGKSPHVTYQMGRARGENAPDKPASWQWIKAADNFLRAINEWHRDPEKWKTEEQRYQSFLAHDQLLRKGGADAARDLAREGRDEANRAMNRNAGDEAIQSAEAEAQKPGKDHLNPAKDDVPEKIEWDKLSDADLDKLVQPDGEPVGDHEEPGDPAVTAAVKGERQPGADLEAFKAKEAAKAAEAKPKLDLKALRAQAEAAAAEEAGATKGEKFNEVLSRKLEEMRKKIAEFKKSDSGEVKIPEFLKNLFKGKTKEEVAEAVKAAPEVPKDQQLNRLPTFQEVPRPAWEAIFGAPGEQSGGLIKQLFNPAAVSDSAKYIASLLREKGGLYGRKLTNAVGRVEQYRRIVNAAPMQDQKNIQYALDEGNWDLVDKKYHPLLEVMRDLSKEIRAEMETLPDAERINFIENHFPHMWLNRTKGEEFVQDWKARQGNASSTKERAFPTIREAEARGLTLAINDPIEVELRYLNSMYNYIKFQRVLEDAYKAGKITTMGPQVTAGGASGNPNPSLLPQGYAELKGRSLFGGQKLYAPVDFARVYNNSIAPGLKADATIAKYYDAFQRTSNFVTAGELGLSAFHGVTMTGEAIISHMAQGISTLAAGDLRGLGQMAAAPFAPLNTTATGAKLNKMISTEGPNSVIPKDIKEKLDLLTQGGFRFGGRGHDPTYSYSQFPDFWTAFQRGATFQSERQAVMDRIQAARADGGNALVAAGKELVRFTARALQTVAKPIFDHYIPSLKTGAAYELMSEYMLHNKDAGHEELVNAAQRISDSIDNRFGEMVHDNIFMHNSIKQMGQLAMRSWSWNLGTVQEIGGGLMGLLKHPERLSIKNPNYDPRAAYVLALPMVVGLTSMAYQYLKTGEGPKDAYDMMVPRTGGYSARYGAPERAIMPGYQKDLYGWFDNPVGEAANKLATLPRMISDTITNTDYAGDPIRDPNDPASKQVMEWLQHVGGNLGPISLRTFGNVEEGTNINTAERAAALRPAPAWMTNPEYIENKRSQHFNRAWRQKEKRDERTQGFRAGG